MKRFIRNYGEKVGTICMVCMIVSGILCLWPVSCLSAWALVIDLGLSWYFDPASGHGHVGQDGRCHGCHGNDCGRCRR